LQTGLKQKDRSLATIELITDGANEKSIIRTETPIITSKGITHREDLPTIERSTVIFNSIEQGMNEKSIVRTDEECSIITVGRDHYGTDHPTEKPIDLMERIIKLMSQTKGITVLDPFAGTCPVGQACINLEINYIGFELDKDYYEIGKNRIEKLQNSKNETLNF
jgi:site-specific DNA-methyltransferase (adenine-specific)